MAWWRRLVGAAGSAPAPAARAAAEPSAGRFDVADLSAMDREVTHLRATQGDDAALAWIAQGQAGAAMADAEASWRLAHGRLLLALGRSDQARDELEAAIGLTDAPGAIQLELARAHIALHDYPAALDCLQLAVTWLPTHGLAWLELGTALLRMDRTAEALAALQTARDLLQTVPPDRQAEPAESSQDAALVSDGVTDLLRCELRLSHAALRESQFQHAVEILRCSVLHSPGIAEAWTALGNAELLLDNDQQAEAAYEQAIHLSATPSTGLVLNHGVVCQNLGRWDLARQRFLEVCRDQPGELIARWYLCQVELALGHWRAGWDLFGLRFTAGALKYRPMPFRQWVGEAAHMDTLLVLADEGIGDEIMYVSCLADAMARVGTCILECEPRLERLFKRSFPDALVIGTDRSSDISWLNGLPTPHWQLSSGDLPRLFRPDIASFEPRRAYLRADTGQTEAWRQRLTADLGPGLKVGISWRGGTDRTRIRARSLALPEWAPILSVPGVRFVSLQYGSASQDLADLESSLGLSVADYPEAHRDYDDTAALVASLDLVISVCTAVIHLAGALGKPVWVLAPYAPSWRYGARGGDMPWYAQVVVKRKTRHDSWDELCQSVANELAVLTNPVAP
jgi:tetratricopeptide (TPR) repeat protein